MIQKPTSLKGLIDTFGNPDINKDGKVDPHWYSENIVDWKVPANWDMRIAWDTNDKVKTFKVHKLIVPVLTKTMTDVWNYARIRAKDKYGPNQTSAFYDQKTNAELALAGMNLFGGAYNFRQKRGSENLSVHSWGCAIDFDPANNAMGDATPKIPEWVVEIFTDNGWFWGGYWKGKRTDPMHFQYVVGY